MEVYKKWRCELIVRDLTSKIRRKTRIQAPTSSFILLILRPLAVPVRAPSVLPTNFPVIHFDVAAHAASALNRGLDRSNSLQGRCPATLAAPSAPHSAAAIATNARPASAKQNLNGLGPARDEDIGSLLVLVKLDAFVALCWRSLVSTMRYF